MPATMPPHLQDRFLAGTWNEQRNKHFREFPTESGKPTRSKLPGSPLTPCSGEAILTESECEDLEGFYVGPCSEGATTFYMGHPRKGTIALCQWVGPSPVSHRAPVVDALGNVTGLYSVPYAVEIY